MRPLRLDVEGFLSYREPTTVDLSGLGAAVILGQNGSGKTSLVEAMGWALFGKGRGRGPDDFVSAGATTCRVAFTFEIAGTTYRAQRQRELGKSSKSYLGLDVDTNDHDGFGWQPVGGDSISECQGEIERVLGMDFDTWLATSFIGQGRADQFTRMRPAERKDLLARVLDLGVWERLAEGAKSREQMTAGALGALARTLEARKTLLEQEAEIRQRREEAARRRDEAEAVLEGARSAVATARRIQAEAADAVSSSERTRTRLEELRVARRQAAERARAELDRAEREADHLAGQVRDGQTSVDKLRQSAGMIEGLEAEEAKRAGELAEAEAAAAAASEEFAAAEARRATYVGRTSELAGRITEATDRRELLHRAPGIGIGKEAACYVCRQLLDEPLREQLLADLDAEGVRLAEEQATAQGGAAREREAAELARTHLGRYRSDVARAQDLVQRAHAAVERSRGDIERLPAETARLEEARARLEETAVTLSRLGAERDAGGQPSHEEQTLAAQLTDVAVFGEQHRAASEELATAEEAERLLAREVAGAAEALGAADARLGEIERAQTESQEAEEQLEELGGYRRRCALLQEAYGRDGIPTLIMENRIAEIQDEANRFLERLSDGRLTVQIESLRATKTGELRETLDIRVADESDERPLEDFSGGERQCVDLALRVGLSRVLARRAGRPMETLILDEAFTALDAGRRQRAIEVIHTLAEEFACVLFITHLPEMGDAFPIRFEVTKNGTSRVEMVTA